MKETAFLPYGRQSIDEADVSRVVEALKSDYLTQGPRIAEFEERLAKRVGARFCVAVNSGTAALHAAYAAAGVGLGTSVLTSPITFVATANASLYLGGSVQFADVDPFSGILDSSLCAYAITRDTRAVVPVHFGGQVADMAAFAALADERGVSVIEDAAHALGATYRIDGVGYNVGACAHSAMCCFSFHPVKHITTGEGGAVTTNDPTLYERLLRFRTHGITRDPASLTMDEGPWYYEQHELGFNYRLTDLQCALGISQLSRLDDFLSARRKLAALYDSAFAGNNNARPTTVPPGSNGAYHLYVVHVPKAVRRAVFEGMRRDNIGVNVHYIPVYWHPYYRRHGFSDLTLTGAESFYEGCLTLPLFPGVSEGDIERVVDSLNRHLAHCLTD